MSTLHERLDAWVDAHSTRKCASCRRWARAHRHAARRQRAARRAHGRAASKIVARTLLDLQQP